MSRLFLNKLKIKNSLQEKNRYKQRPVSVFGAADRTCAFSGAHG